MVEKEPLRVSTVLPIFGTSYYRCARRTEIRWSVGGAAKGARIRAYVRVRYQDGGKKVPREHYAG
jgi:hypothetical protein